jgi:hypothetical protein
MAPAIVSPNLKLAGWNFFGACGWNLGLGVDCCGSGGAWRHFLARAGICACGGQAGVPVALGRRVAGVAVGLATLVRIVAGGALWGFLGGPRDAMRCGIEIDIAEDVAG